MSIDYTRGDSPAYDGHRESWASQREAELQARIDELEAELVQRGEMKTAYDENGVPYLVEAEGSEAEHIIDLLKAKQDGLLVVLPCKVGTPIYHEGLISCPDCPHVENQTLSGFYKDVYGEPYADECREVCPSIVRSQPFSIAMLENDGTLTQGFYLSPEEAEAALEKGTE